MKGKIYMLMKRWGFSLSAMILGTGLILLVLVHFNFGTKTMMEKFVRSNMDETNQAAILSLNHDFNCFMKSLLQQENIFSMMDHPSDGEIMETISGFAETQGYKNAAIVTYDGKVYSSFRGITQVTENDKVPNLRNDATVVSEPRVFFDNTLVIDISTPVDINGETIGKLVISVGSEYLTQLFSDNIFNGNAALNLITKEGVVITRISQRQSPLEAGSNVFDFYEGVAFTDGNIDTLQACMSNGDSCWLKYNIGGEDVGVSYRPSGINGWYMAIATTEKTLYAQSNAVKTSVLWLSLVLMLIVVAVAIFVAIQHQKAQKKMVALKNTYNIAIKKTNDLFYEANIDSDELIDYSEQMDKAVWKQSPKNYSSALSQIVNNCAPEYKQGFLDTFLPQNIRIKMKEDISSINFEYRIVSDTGVERWISATFVPISDGDGTKLICMENDVTERKHRQEQLKKSAILDGLTGLYNRTTIKSATDRFLQSDGENGVHAIVLIDIDHFKLVNDTLGHMTGDAVLIELGCALKNIFRKSDIVGRLGGDEFAVLIKEFGTTELLVQKMDEVLGAFKRVYTADGDAEETVEISGSIGIALYSENGRTFDQLYQNADLALYASKNNGRNRYTFYTPGMQ